MLTTFYPVSLNGSSYEIAIRDDVADFCNEDGGVVFSITINKFNLLPEEFYQTLISIWENGYNQGQTKTKREIRNALGIQS